MNIDILRHSDSYKYSHWMQYPKDTNYVSSYITARKIDGMTIPNNQIVFFGLRAYIKKYLSDVVLTPNNIRTAARMAKAHGIPFNEAGWMAIMGDYPYGLPLEIQAVPEGSVVSPQTPLVQINNTDPRFPWLTNFVETSLLRAIWYPSTVASLSYAIKKNMKRYWDEAVADDNQCLLSFVLHDFGARGVSSSESAALGGLGHLLSFNGTDTIEALYAADEFYPEHYYIGNSTDKVPLMFEKFIAGYSVPAAEHSTITAWGKDNEDDAILNMIECYGGEGKIYSVVGDSYDINSFVDRVSSGSIHQAILAKGGRFVIRPDSGDPIDGIEDILNILGRNLCDITINSKGFKVLPNEFRILWGDGIDAMTITGILDFLVSEGWSPENLVFGMGGALLQKVNRDTLSFAMKANAIIREGSNSGDWVPVYKSPKTDPSKASQAGRVENGLVPYYKDGISFYSDSFSTIRDRVRATL